MLLFDLCVWEYIMRFRNFKSNSTKIARYEQSINDGVTWGLFFIHTVGLPTCHLKSDKSSRNMSAIWFWRDVRALYRPIRNTIPPPSTPHLKFFTQLPERTVATLRLRRPVWKNDELLLGLHLSPGLMCALLEMKHLFLPRFILSGMCISLLVFPPYSGSIWLSRCMRKLRVYIMTLDRAQILIINVIRIKCEKKVLGTKSCALCFKSITADLFIQRVELEHGRSAPTQQIRAFIGYFWCFIETYYIIIY